MLALSTGRASGWRLHAGVIAKRPSVVASATTAALIALTLLLPQRPVSLAAGHAGAALPRRQPSGAADGAPAPPGAQVRVVTLVRRTEAPPTTPYGAQGPAQLPVATGNVLTRSPCPGVRVTGRLAVVGMPDASSSVWDTASAAVNSGQQVVGVPPAGVGGGAAVASTSFVVPGGRPGRLLASDGTKVLRTSDGGCSWAPVLSLDPTAHPAGASVTDGAIPVPPGYAVTAIAAAGDQVYATIAPPWWSTAYGTYGGHVVLAASADGGTTWSASVPLAGQPVSAGGMQVTSAMQALPAGSGYPQLLAVAPTDPHVVYLETAADAAPGTSASSGRMRLFVSRDGGSTWQLAAVPIRPGPHWAMPALYAVGTAEDYLFQLRVDPSRPGRIYGLGVETPPGTTPPRANGVDGADTQNGRFESDGTLYVSGDYGKSWTGLAAPTEDTGVGYPMMTYIDDYAVADHGSGFAAAVVEHYLDPQTNGFVYVVLRSTDNGTHWTTLPSPTTLREVYLPVGEESSQAQEVTTDGVYNQIQPLWLSFLPDGVSLSLGVDPAPGITTASIRSYRLPPGAPSWQRVGSSPVGVAGAKYDVRDWNFNPVAPALDQAAGLVYTVVQCRSVVENAVVATIDDASGETEQMVSYAGPVYLIANHE